MRKDEEKTPTLVEWAVGVEERFETITSHIDRLLVLMEKQIKINEVLLGRVRPLESTAKRDENGS